MRFIKNPPEYRLLLIVIADNSGGGESGAFRVAVGAPSPTHDHDATNVDFAFQSHRAHKVSLETCICAGQQMLGSGCCVLSAAFDAFMGDVGAAAIRQRRKKCP